MLFIFLEGIGCHGKDGNPSGIRSRQRADFPGCRQPIHDRHHHIHQNKLKITFFRFREQIQRFLSVVSFRHLHAGIGEQEFRNFHVQLIVLYHQHVHAFQKVPGTIFFLRFFFFIRIVNFKRDHNRKGTSHIQFAFYLNGTAHHLHKLFDNSQSQPGSHVGCPCPLIFLGKRLKGMFQKRFTHAAASIFTAKLVKSCFSVKADFLTAKMNGTAFPVIFYRIPRNVLQNLL